MLISNWKKVCPLYFTHAYHLLILCQFIISFIVQNIVFHKDKSGACCHHCCTKKEHENNWCLKGQLGLRTSKNPEPQIKTTNKQTNRMRLQKSFPPLFKAFCFMKIKQGLAESCLTNCAVVQCTHCRVHLWPNNDDSKPPIYLHETQGFDHWGK